MGKVISIVSRRRGWTLEQKLALVEAVLQPGASVAAVSDRHGVSRSLLFEWRRQARAGSMPGMVHGQAPAALAPVRVVPMRVVEYGAPKQAPPRRGAGCTHRDRLHPVAPPPPIPMRCLLSARPTDALSGRFPGVFGAKLLTARAPRSPKIALRRPILSGPDDLAVLVRNAQT